MMTGWSDCPFRPTAQAVAWRYEYLARAECRRQGTDPDELAAETGRRRWELIVATNLKGVFEIVTQNSFPVGSTFRTEEGVFAAELSRAGANKPLGDFPSRRKARQAVLNATALSTS